MKNYQKKLVAGMKKWIRPVIWSVSLLAASCATEDPSPRSEGYHSGYSNMGRLILPAALFDSKEPLVVLANENPITVQLNPALRHGSVLLKITDLEGRAFYDRNLFGKLYLFSEEPENIMDYINMTAEGLPNDVMILPLNVEFKILIEQQSKVIFERNFKIEE